MNANSSPIGKLDLSQYYKDVYGVTDKEIKDLKKFSSDLIEASEKFLTVKNKDSVKKIISLFNLFPAYGGHAIMEGVEEKKPSLLEDLTINLLKYYNSSKETEKGTDFLKDLSEVVLSIIFYSPDQQFRKVLIKNIDDILPFILENPAKAGLFCYCAAKLSDLFLASQKSNTLYTSSINKLYLTLKKRVTEANSILPEIPDALNVSLKDMKKLFFSFKEESKKLSIDQLKIILTRKADLGNFLYYLCLFIEYCTPLILLSEEIDKDIVESTLPQLKLQQILEMSIFVRESGASAHAEIIENFLTENYNISRGQIIEKTRDLVTKYASSKFGILIRNPMMMPIEKDAKTVMEALKSMQSKLSTLANNATAKISVAGLSMSIALTSKTDLFQDFEKEYEQKTNPSAAGKEFLDKMKDKDFVRKIKESNIAVMNLDQTSCRNVICVLLALQEAMPQNFTLQDKEELYKQAFKIIVQKYKVVTTKTVFIRFADIFFTKIPQSLLK